jgi:DNA-binding transcriptional LysR family regulator
MTHHQFPNRREGRMQIRWIEDFLTLADAKGFARAAERRHVSQPTFSRHLQSLEAWLGVALVDRRVQGVQLTPSGKLFREFAVDLLRRTYDMRALLRGQATPTESLVRFSVAHTLALGFFPQWLGGLEQALGKLRSHVGAVNIADGARSLAEGATDLLIVYHHPQLPLLLDPRRFPHLTLGTERMAPFTAPLPGGAPKFRLPGKGAAPLPFLSYSSGTYLGQVVEMILLAAGQPAQLQRSFDTHMAEALKAMVLAGHGLGWLPQGAAAREVKEGLLVPAGPARWTCELEVRLHRRADIGNDRVEQIWALLKTQLSS